MRLVTYIDEAGSDRLGALRAHDSEIVDLQSSHRRRTGSDSNALSSMLALIESGPGGLEVAGAALAGAAAESTRAADTSSLQAPLPEPRKLRDFLAYEAHLQNMNRHMKTPTPISDLWYERPLFAKCNHFSVVGPETPVIWPPYSDRLDFELELACVIGRDGKDILPADAMSHVFGFTIFNDVSARDEQLREWNPMGSMKGKDFDTGNILGPCIVTADEFGDPYAVRAVARVNGEEWGRATAPEMYHRWDAIIAYASLSETIRAGEVFGSGTLPTCCGAEHGRFPRPGDVVELEVAQIGILRNRFGEVSSQ
jgi:2-keto-4-pentenoate hydratase/2-oxohepta-3-ene-1,7-dioic acid hydratase in catechol pathway